MLIHADGKSPALKVCAMSGDERRLAVSSPEKAELEIGVHRCPSMVKSIAVKPD
jgi:hypothetical protein